MLETPPGWTGCANDPDAGDPWDFDPHFVPMLTLNKNSLGFDPDPGPVYAALKTQYNRFFDIIDDSDGQDHLWLHIAVGKFNFGDSSNSGLDFWAAPGGNGPSGQPHVIISVSPSIRSEKHPWMWSQVDSARDWAEEFVDVWKSDTDADSIPPPIRFLLDTERQVFGDNGLGSTLNTAILSAVFEDPRASVDSGDPTKHNLPYPGAATTSTNKPLNDWLDDADSAYGSIASMNLNPLACISGVTTNYNVMEHTWGTGLVDATLADPRNIARYQWYRRLWDLSFDAAFDRAIYSVVSDVSLGWGDDCKTAMYGRYDVPGADGFSPLWSDEQRSPELADVAALFPWEVAGYPFVFGWSFDLAIDRFAQTRNDLLSPACRGTPEVRVGGVPTNVWLLGTPTNDREGSTQQYTASGRWSSHSFNNTTADFDSPICYGIRQYCSDSNGAPYALPDHQRPNLYLPPWSSPRDPEVEHNLYEVDPADSSNQCPRDDHYLGSARTCKAPPETLEQASVRVIRRSIESIAAGKEGSTLSIVPWVPLIGAVIHNTSPPQTASADLVRHILGLMRGKDIRELQVYGDRFPVCPGGGGTQWPVMANWTAFQTVYNEVYNLGHTDYAILNGYYNQTGDEGRALSRTNLDLSESPVGLVPVTMTIESETVSNTEVTAVALELKGTRVAPTSNGRLRIILEGDVERLCTPGGEDPEFCPERCVPQGADMKDIRGRIYAFDWGTTQWVHLTAADYSDGSYGFYAPRESCRPYDATYAGSFRSMRRTFEFGPMDLTEFVKTEGGEHIINLKPVQTGDEPFITKYDLVQCLYINGSTVSASPACDALPLTEEEEEEEQNMLVWGPGAPQGGDMNYDGWHGEEDTLAFSLAYMTEHPSADVNNDSLIDGADVAQYFSTTEVQP
ncbi:MAG: hypothetical protein JNK25_03215 [Phycisphaerae bacterium]|nr:hypothetical protein [Phycisphaerae bacterium]